MVYVIGDGWDNRSQYIIGQYKDIGGWAAGGCLLFQLLCILLQNQICIIFLLNFISSLRYKIIISFFYPHSQNSLINSKQPYPAAVSVRNSAYNFQMQTLQINWCSQTLRNKDYSQVQECNQRDIGSFRVEMYIVLNANLFSTSIIIFQQKIAMTTPTNYMGQYLQMPYPPLNQLWAFPRQNILNNPYNFQFRPFPNQLSYPYVHVAENSFNRPQVLSYNMNCMPLGYRDGSVSSVMGVGGGSIVVQNKFQKLRVPNEQASVILISDDQEPVQTEKPCEDKNTSANSKINEYNGLINSQIIQKQKTEQKCQKKTQSKQTITSKEKHIPKIKKSKDIIKVSISHKKHKSKIIHSSATIKNGPVFSKRIIEKQDCKKQPFRLSKRQKELLEVSYLRELNNAILTGPQFQAKLPLFVGRSEDCRQWLKLARIDLLHRIYKEQQQ